ncbi:hypothetical protein NLJ89_g11397 [Agrocybe chaxingu]|uniref:Uncharacterized protein n=1 Tax=Agrocybe chaxingu TaxID=84603 RepID=A0A9W8MPE5_9AGAR|nr:hypothetical protein NLJ89_g11397 [Agrocybe chaxingu]
MMWVLQVILSSIGMTTGFAVPLPPGLVGSSALFPAVWVTPLATDFCIFILTVLRMRTHFRAARNTPTLQLILRDGVLYFLVILIANLVNTFFFFFSEPDLKAIGASFSQLVTSTMISRLVLNLRSIPSQRRSTARESEHMTEEGPPLTTFMTRTVTHLAEDLEWYNNSSEIPLTDLEKRASTAELY